MESRVARRPKRKSVLRVSRISEDVDRLLQKDAEEKGISVNALINSIFTKYAEWDRYAGRFGYVSIGKDLLTSVLAATDEKKLAEIGDELGSELTRQFILFWFKRVSLETFLSYFSLVCRYGGIAKYEMEVRGNEYVITAIHELGMPWSDFLKHFIDHGMRDNLGIVAQFDLSRNSVVARFVAS
ncbi:MAG TPA: hypothetical protein VEC08_04085 [Nitrososphaerales archaeon]|nr:hypothetical protein [Nitrososphaerales archaeon]